MKNTELRIGNYIDNGGESITVKFWMLDDLPYTLDGYKPIPLTEEWLKKFGFEKHGKKFIVGNHDSGMYKIYQPTIFNSPVPIWEFFDGDYEEDIYISALKYVHSLQNLYFALTGKELEIK